MTWLQLPISDSALENPIWDKGRSQGAQSQVFSVVILAPLFHSCSGGSHRLSFPWSIYMASTPLYMLIFPDSPACSVIWLDPWEGLLQRSWLSWTMPALRFRKPNSFLCLSNSEFLHLHIISTFPKPLQLVPVLISLCWAKWPGSCVLKCMWTSILAYLSYAGCRTHSINRIAPTSGCS
jgi:hypothetical protein